MYKLTFAPVCVFAVTLLFGDPCAAQVESGVRSRPRISESVQDAERAFLRGNVRPETRPENDRGRVADSYPMEHMLLQLKRSNEQERALQQFIDSLDTQGSPN